MPSLIGSDHVVLSAALGGVAGVLIIALETFVPRTTGLQPAVLIFGSFIITTIASCVTLFTIVLYGSGPKWIVISPACYSLGPIATGHTCCLPRSSGSYCARLTIRQLSRVLRQ